MKISTPTPRDDAERNELYEIAALFKAEYAFAKFVLDSPAAPAPPSGTVSPRILSAWLASRGYPNWAIEATSLHDVRLVRRAVLRAKLETEYPFLLFKTRGLT